MKNLLLIVVVVFAIVGLITCHFSTSISSISGMIAGVATLLLGRIVENE